MIPTSLRAPAALAALLFASGPMAHAHDFIVKPEAGHAEAGETLPVSLIVTEVYLKPGRMPPEDSTLDLITREGTASVVVEADDARGLMAGTVTVPGSGALILHGYSTRSRQNRQPEGETGDPGMLKMEWFSKALINPAAGDEIFAKALGDRVEIIPLVNPAGLRPGDRMTVKVLFDGQPVSARLGATFDGFSDEEHGYVVRTESGKDGLASFTVTEPGLWFVRSKVSLDEDTPTHSKYEGAANIVFPVTAPE
ncbi:DUF4198 domain-containing protein [Henriciella aquimarina]|uniref:DUF4198 domain-containing protein n=1 Tax=Henriciella aquimarina TaxID=545261 RepID=UPI000A013DA6|nr:DUF4198 domain-containing protein [Henriciella aquimarina]